MVWVLTKVRRKGERRRRPMSAVAIWPVASSSSSFSFDTISPLAAVGGKEQGD